MRAKSHQPFGAGAPFNTLQLETLEVYEDQIQSKDKEPKRAPRPIRVQNPNRLGFPRILTPDLLARASARVLLMNRYGKTLVLGLLRLIGKGMQRKL